MSGAAHPAPPAPPIDHGTNDDGDRHKKKIYFAHSTSDFNTDFERAVVSWLEQVYEVLNPNCPEGAAAYKTSGMKWFNEQADSAEVGCFLPLPNGMVGSGVALGIDKMLKRGITVYVIEGGWSAAGNAYYFSMRKITAVGNRINAQETGALTRHYQQQKNGGRAGP